MYGDSGNGTSTSAYGRLDKTLGMLSAISVVARNVRNSGISDPSCRKVVRILRAGVDNVIVNAWNLLPLFLNTLQSFLNELMALGKVDYVECELLSWAKERCGTYDGLTLALLLFLETSLSRGNHFRVCTLTLRKFVLLSWSRCRLEACRDCRMRNAAAMLQRSKHCRGLLWTRSKPH